jgi:hypothetical protein
MELDVVGEVGATVHMRCEMRAATLLKRSGWSTEMFKPGARVDIVGRPLVKAGTTGPLSGSIIVSGLRGAPGYVPGKLYFLDVRYAPVFNLATGLPKAGASVRGGSGARGVSDVLESDIVITSVPRMPMTTSEIEISAKLCWRPIPRADTSETDPLSPRRDDLTTPAVETSYTNHYISRLDYANGHPGDSDFDGSLTTRPS